MGTFGNRSSGGIKQYGSGTAWIRTVDQNTNAPSGTLSSWTQIGYFRNSKITLEAGTTKDYYDDGNNLVSSVVSAPTKGTITLDLMERDDSVRNTFNTSQGLYYEFCLQGATLTYSGTKKEVWIAPYAQIDQAFDYSVGAEESYFPIKLICTGAKGALSHALPASLSGTTATISASQIFWTQDV